MSSGSLYAELGLDFQPEERRMFLEEFADVVSSYKTSLGPEGGTEEGDVRLKNLSKELQEETVHFVPQLPVEPLTRKVFTDLGLKPPANVDKLFKQWNFYSVKFPIHLHPKGEGWSFNRLECIVEFSSGQPSSKLPVAYQIFPDAIWEEVLSVSLGLRVVVDEALKFKLDPGQAEILSKLPAAIKAEVALASGAKAILGPFDHRILKSKVFTSGCGDVKVRWDLKGEGQILQQDPSLGVVLQVPRTVPQVNAKGAMAAYRTFDFWNTDLRYVMQFLSDRTRNFIELGAPAIPPDQSWPDITAGI